MSEAAEKEVNKAKNAKSGVPTRRLASKKVRKPGECSCDKPTPAKGTMEKVSGGQIHYIYCDVCMEVLDWDDTGKKSLSTTDYSGYSRPETEKVITPEPDTVTKSDVTDQPSGKVTENTTVETAEEVAEKTAEKATESTNENQGNHEPKQGAFFVTQITPVLGKSNEMNFVCQNNGRFFVVNVPSTEKKVARALANRSLIVGKKVVLEFTETDSAGNPVNAKALRVEK